MELKYGKTLDQVKSVDLSSNNLSGEIPAGIAKLEGLVTLNLSTNRLTGIIPPRIGLMRSLESLDLSADQLPDGLRDMSFLSSLNVSCKNLTGKIPFRTQLQSFGNSSVVANPELCGKPLSNDCAVEQAHDPSISQGRKNVDIQDEDGFISRGFYLRIGLDLPLDFGQFAALYFRLGLHQIIRSFRLFFYFRLGLHLCNLLTISPCYSNIPLWSLRFHLK
ncbi:hypothetical protein SADUNF_Sadunf01G0032800 [Salix dunnii]|uniref:Uncharacterized protein n=1 Tax=Salix dunnii TaxID=1413687 RepID=A0A835N9S1_9ROSI|nr:hypothetical protein SADUNF_Sadunf01G0032800 [Salix dunnii]